MPKPGLGDYPTTGLGSNKPRSRRIVFIWGYPDPIGDRKAEKTREVDVAPKRTIIQKWKNPFQNCLVDLFLLSS
jgi:hypothetical protein